MTKWVSTPIQLTAAMVAGTAPLFPELPIAVGNQGVMSIQSRSGSTIEFFFGPAGATAAGVAGQGLLLNSNARWDIFGYPEFNGAIFIRGGTAGEYVVLLIS